MACTKYANVTTTAATPAVPIRFATTTANTSPATFATTDSGATTRVDAQVVVVPRQQREPAVVTDPPAVLGRLPALRRVGAHGVHVREGVGHVARQPYHDASRASTSACLRRMSGATTAPVSAMVPSSTPTSSGSYCQSTTDAKASGTTLATIWNDSVSTKSSYSDA